MSTDALHNETDTVEEHFDAQEYHADGADEPPTETESAILSVVMFGGLIAFAAGCWLMGGFG